jgi:putative N-acetylmannosamine-6-phosphate epimerase
VGITVLGTSKKDLDFSDPYITAAREQEQETRVEMASRFA